MSESRTIHLTVPENLAGGRLDKVLAALVAGETELPLSRMRLQALIENGNVKNESKGILSPKTKVKAGEKYSILVPPPEPAVLAPERVALVVVFEDADVLVLDKPAGVVVHPAPGNRSGTLVNALLAHCGQSLSGIGGVVRPGIVHRLDKDTSGLLVVAKNDASHQGLTAQFSDRSLTRVYHAVVWGTITPLAGRIETKIGRDKRDRKKMSVTGNGRSALTFYKVLEAFGPASLVECTLATGRTHQIRVHLAHLRHGVIGDRSYGGSRGRMAKGCKVPQAAHEFPRQALHASRLTFVHPRTKKKLTFQSDLPKDIKTLLESLRNAHENGHKPY